MLRVSDVMTRAPVAIPENASVRDALEVLETLEIRHLPVVSKHGILLGMVSERDLYTVFAPRAELAGHRYQEARARLGEPITRGMMVTQPIIVEDDAPLEIALKRILEGRVSAIPVVHAGKLMGIISYVDLLRVLGDRLAGEAKVEG